MGLLALAALPAAAQDGQVSRMMDRAIEQMDSPSLAEREEATDRLKMSGGLPLELVIQRLQSDDLSPEQRARLEGVGEAIFATRPRAAMGIQFGGEHEKGVIIGRTIEGFDAALKLLPDDVVMTADGEPLIETDLLREIIVSHDPGDELELRVLRGGQETTVRVRLGRFSDLGQQRLDAATRKAAWHRRIERDDPAGLHEVPALKPEVVDIDATEVLVEGDPGARGRAGRATPAPGVSAAGPGRLADPRLDTMQPLGVPVTRVPGDLDRAEQLRELQGQVAQLQGSLQIAEQRVDTLREQLAGVEDQPTRRTIEARLISAVEMSRELSLEMERVRREITRLSR